MITVSVYVDDGFVAGDWGRWSGGGHLQADTVEELHDFAARLGLKRSWFQSKPGRPWHDHYDWLGPFGAVYLVQPHDRGRSGYEQVAVVEASRLREAEAENARLREQVALKMDDKDRAMLLAELREAREALRELADAGEALQLERRPVRRLAPWIPRLEEACARARGVLEKDDKETG